MKKLMFLAGAVALLVAAPAPAHTAKTVAVDISKAGFVPGEPVGSGGRLDDVDEQGHGDTPGRRARPVRSPRRCSRPGQTFTFTFTKVGKFATVDPLNKNKK